MKTRGFDVLAELGEERYFTFSSGWRHATYWRISGLTNTPHTGVLSATMNAPTFLRRLGPKSECFKTEACPDILELADGDFAVIGLDITAESVGRLPPSVGCGKDERIVRIPRKILVQAIPDIPKS